MNLFKKDENGRTPWQNMLRRREARASRERIRLEKGRLHLGTDPKKLTCVVYQPTGVIIQHVPG